MRFLQLVRRHPLPAILLLLVFSAVTTFGVRALLSQPLEQPIATTDEKPVAEPASSPLDGRYTIWQSGEYVPESTPTTQVVPAIAPLPKPDAWSQLSSLEVALGGTDERESREPKLPAPAGLDASMNPFDRDGILAGSSVESGFQGDVPVPVILVGGGRGGMSGGVCRATTH
jgi:hypothetical protein